MMGEEHVSTEDLVRLLVERGRESGAADVMPRQVSDANPGDDVVLDIEVQGSRYLLVRLPKPAQLDVQLSPREREIVRLVARGHSNKIIADVLSISSWTVCTHLRRIFTKLGVTSRAAMVARMPEIGRTSVPAPPPRESPATPRKLTAALPKAL